MRFCNIAFFVAPSTITKHSTNREHNDAQKLVIEVPPSWQQPWPSSLLCHQKGCPREKRRWILNICQSQSLVETQHKDFLIIFCVFDVHIVAIAIVIFIVIFILAIWLIYSQWDCSQRN